MMFSAFDLAADLLVWHWHFQQAGLRGKGFCIPFLPYLGCLFFCFLLSASELVDEYNDQIMIIELLLLLLQTLIKRFDSFSSHPALILQYHLEYNNDREITLPPYIYIQNPAFFSYRFTAHISTTHTPNCPTFVFRLFLFRTGSWSLGTLLYRKFVLYLPCWFFFC